MVSGSQSLTALFIHHDTNYYALICTDRLRVYTINSYCGFKRVIYDITSPIITAEISNEKTRSAEIGITEDNLAS